MISIFAILMLAACSNEKSSKEKDIKSNAEEQVTKDGNDKGDQEEKTGESNTSEKEDAEDTSGAVKPQSAAKTVSFTQVTWFYGSPKRELNPGVWYYTASDHPEKFATTFDWEEEDVLLWQIGDEKYKGYGAETEQLQVLDNDVIKIIVKLEDESWEEMPRRFLKVAKGH